MHELFGRLSDLFAVPGVMLTGIGVLSWVAEQGGFDLVTYAFSRTRGSYADHRARRNARRRGHPRLLHWGLGLLGVSGLFLALYYL